MRCLRNIGTTLTWSQAGACVHVHLPTNGLDHCSHRDKIDMFAPGERLPSKYGAYVTLAQFD